MDDESYWELMEAIGAARSVAELELITQRLRALPEDDRVADLGEMLFMKHSVFAAVEAGQYQAEEPQRSGAGNRISG
jgi:hypothetical protein